MAKNPASLPATVQRAASSSGASEPITTQRAYTLRLRGTDPKDTSWRDALWATHEAINAGAKVFGDWLLTLRGGLSHELAEPPPPPRGKTRSDGETAALRKNRRILLALSWLSVEDERGAPKDLSRVAMGTDSDSARREQLIAALREILVARRVGTQEIEFWIADCADSLSSKIRDEAAWINRSAAFAAAKAKIGPSLTCDEVWDILEPFFSSREAYLAPVDLVDDEDSGAKEKAKDLVQKAGQWLSSRFGTGTGADFASMARVYAAMAEWAKKANAFPSGADALVSLGKSLAHFMPESMNAEGILGLISGPGYKSATRNLVKAWGDRLEPVSNEDLAKFAEVAAEDEAKCKGNSGGKGRRPWSDRILQDVESACGFTYLQENGPARHSEFAVMLDHAARRVSIGHSWIKRAEAERRRFEEDARRLAAVPPATAAWLDDFVQDRSGTSGAAAAGGEYRIRRRAIEGWDEIVKRWKRAACKTAEDRIAAARETQADPEIDKFGDIQLFEALAADEALCVWKPDSKPDPQPLKDYVLGHDAQFKQRRFKVPAYRHPDPLRHPVFGDFGNSRWDITYAVHEAAKSARKKRAPSTSDAAWFKDSRGLRMGLWNGSTVGEVAMRWSSKRLAKDLALGQPVGDGSARDVTRADRLGRAAAGLKQDEAPAPAGLFALADWNGRLQAPRAQLDALAECIRKHHGADAAIRPGSLDAIFRRDERARRMRDRIEWLVSFSAKLECRGPWYDYFDEQTNRSPFQKVVTSGPRKGQTYESVNGWPHATVNNDREGHAKLILSRLPGLRVLSVDLGHRYAAACAVWETFSAEEMKEACRERGHRAPLESDLFIHLTRTIKKPRKKGRDKGKIEDVIETTIYRRVGEDFLRDPKTGEPTGTPHPAPWARLDRQFVIKLQGEEKPARAASSRPEHGINETKLVKDIAADLGLLRDEADDAGSRGVDELMRRAMRIATLGLKRHGRMARIAYALNPDCPGIPGMGGAIKSITRGDEDHIRFLTSTLADWHALATDTEWNGSRARELWNEHIRPLPGGFEVGEPAQPDPRAEQPTRQQKRKMDDEFRETRIKPLAEHLAKRDPSATAEMHKTWKRLWDAADGEHAVAPKVENNQHEPGKTTVTTPATGWHARLRLLTDWIMGRRLPGAHSQHWNRNVGGLSLTRIATMRSLYQLHKAFAMRPRPDKVQGAPERGESNLGIAQSILGAMERMREQRVKQIASRIAASALGLGGHWKDVERRDHKGKPLLGKDGKPRMKRVWVEEPYPKYPPCHAVVIENLRNYRPDELRTRRENKALMSWSSGKVRKYLEEACQLHGLHLREVMPNYTSRQCSRTGLPGIRCVDVAVDPQTGEPKAYWWKNTLAAAQKKGGSGDAEDQKGDAESRFIVDLARHLADRQARGESLPKSVRLPRKGGDIFISAAPWSCRKNGHSPCPLCDSRRAVQADLNAAANIGLRALLDPDFSGKWWYVPCDSATGKPAKDKCQGAACIDLDKKLMAPPEKTKGEKFNAWRDVRDQRTWVDHGQYWNGVRARVIAALRSQNNLKESHIDSLAAAESPW